MATTGVKCWGLNRYGQLGDGTTFQSNKPRDVSGLANGVSALTAGGYHTCAIANGGVKCWGDNANGQLGDDGKTTLSPVPVDTVGIATGATAVTGGGSHTCALLSDKTAKCWGLNDKGQLGDATTDRRLTPVTVAGLTGIEMIAAGGPHTCAITSGGTTSCWGSGAAGELGDWAQANRLTPFVAQGAASGATTLGLGQSHTCVELDNGLGKQVVSCFGWDGSGQLGLGAATRRVSPIPAQADVPAALTVSAGTGKSGSEFILTGVRFERGQSVSFTINGTPVAAPTLDPSQAQAGSFALDLLTAADNGEGIYTVKATSGSRTASATITLGNSHPTRVEPGSSASISAAGIQPAQAKRVYLPLQLR
jgi:alpha-tubulin suppressor-like RCC1 family protein